MSERYSVVLSNAADPEWFWGEKRQFPQVFVHEWPHLPQRGDVLVLGEDGFRVLEVACKLPGVGRPWRYELILDPIFEWDWHPHSDAIREALKDSP